MQANENPTIEASVTALSTYSICLYTRPVGLLLILLVPSWNNQVGADPCNPHGQNTASSSGRCLLTITNDIGKRLKTPNPKDAIRQCKTRSFRLSGIHATSCRSRGLHMACIRTLEIRACMNFANLRTQIENLFFIPVHLLKLPILHFAPSKLQLQQHYLSSPITCRCNLDKAFEKGVLIIEQKCRLEGSNPSPASLNRQSKNDLVVLRVLPAPVLQLVHPMASPTKCLFHSILLSLFTLLLLVIKE